MMRPCWHCGLPTPVLSAKVTRVLCDEHQNAHAQGEAGRRKQLLDIPDAQIEAIHALAIKHARITRWQALNARDGWR